MDLEVWAAIGAKTTQKNGIKDKLMMVLLMS